MQKEIELKLRPAEAEDEALIRRRAAEKCQWKLNEISEVKLFRRSIDARSRRPFVRLRLKVYREEKAPVEPALLDQLQEVHEKPAVIIVGAGPAGYFAGLELLELGLKPILFDRGKDVQSRRRDL